MTHARSAKLGASGRARLADPAGITEACEQQKIDRILEQTFPASDPPAWTSVRPSHEAIYTKSLVAPPVRRRAPRLARSPVRIVQLRERREIAEGTFAFLFDKPPGFRYEAGQFVRLKLRHSIGIDPTGHSRIFSLASAPSENFLMIATRLRGSAFKQALRTVPLGIEVELRGPGGDMTPHRDSGSPGVLLAGGIGITPFRSVLVEADAAKLPNRFYLFYSNRRPEDAPFLDELEALERRNSNFTLIATMTQMKASRRPWSGETSVLDQEMLARFLTAASAPVYDIAGPPRMVNGLRLVLERAGTRGDRIRTQTFEGY